YIAAKTVISLKGGRPPRYRRAIFTTLDMVGQYMQKKEEDKQIAEDQAAKDRYWKIPICYDDDDDEESSIP
ncbi:hypothetical protein Tco_1188427, partial [Tanacetum coccineum]